jgi:hypothetical protein
VLNRDVILRGTKRSEVEAQNPSMPFTFLSWSSMTAKTKWKKTNDIPETATPHRVPLWGTILSRKGRGNDTTQ